MRSIPTNLARIAVAAIFAAALLVAVLLRGGSADVEGDAAEVRLVFVGDLMVGRYVGASMLAHGYDGAFDDVRGLISGADLAVGNLEGPVVPPGRFALPPPSPQQPLLTGSELAAQALARAGFDLLSVANNHSMDAGAAGFQSSARALREAGIEPLGLDVGGEQEPVVRDLRGLKIAFLAYTAISPGKMADGNSAGAGPAYVDPAVDSSEQRISLEVGRAKKAADVVVVVMHWGTEYSARPDDAQQRLAQAASRAGAGLVVGAHPHVVQGMQLAGEEDRPTLVAYSLGNALFDQGAREETRQGAALECTLDRRGVKAARLIPLEIGRGKNGYVMLQADNSTGQAALQRAATGSPDNLRWSAIWDASQKDPGVAVAYRRRKDTRPAEVDLGMGVRSRVSLSNGVLSVSEKDPSGSWRSVWQSRPGWRVTGYTVGDADADGRPELVYALWKPSLVWRSSEGGGMSVDQDGGEVRPHIYIEGWRRGAMRAVWHGSPRPAPLVGVAVAPVGPSGKPLLATLESADTQQGKAPGTIRLWEWTGGFGYELAAALPGAYSQMWSDGRILLFR